MVKTQFLIQKKADALFQDGKLADKGERLCFPFKSIDETHDAQYQDTNAD